jgi:hypothetical protein
MASKKQINDLENAVVALEEKIEKMEEEHHMLKQMISMQTALIENLQFVVKMMGQNQTQRVVHIGGNKNDSIDGSKQEHHEDDNDENKHESENQGNLKKSDGKGKTLLSKLNHRMARVV